MRFASVGSNLMLDEVHLVGEVDAVGFVHARHVGKEIRPCSERRVWERRG